MDTPLQPDMTAGQSRALGGLKDLKVYWRKIGDPDFGADFAPDFAVQWRLEMNAGTSPVPLAHGTLTRNDPDCEIDMTPVYHDPNIKHGLLELRAGTPNQTSLWCDIPLDPSSFCQDCLDSWSVRPEPHDEDEYPPPDPFDPPVDGQGHRRLPWGGQIEPADMVDFLWIDPPTSPILPGAFAAFADGGGNAAKLTLALQFATAIQAHADPAQAYAALQSTSAAFIKTHWPLTPAAQTLAEALAAALDCPPASQVGPEPEHGEPESMELPADETPRITPETFQAAGSAPADSLFALVWQLLYAVAMVQGANPPALAADAMPDAALLARAARAMSLIIGLARGDTALLDPAVRARFSTALLVLPDCVLPPLPAATAMVECLGVGEQKTISQRLKTYVLGEIAEMINVMPGEQLTLSDRDRSEISTQTRHKSGDISSEIHDEQTGNASDLAQTLRDALTQAEVNRNYSKLSIAPGTWPDLVANGSWWGWDGEQGRKLDRAVSFMQSLSRQAAKQMTARVTQLRASATVRERESTVTRAIDNRQSAAALRGAYHWLEKIYELRMRSKGRHLVLEFLLASPGERLRAEAKAWPKLSPILPPEQWGITCAPEGYVTVTADNYASAGAAYGLVLPPPPPTSLVVSAALNAPGQSTHLVIPPGYAASAFSLSYVISDATLSLSAMIGTMPVTLTPPPPAPSISVVPGSLPAAPVPTGPPAIPDPQGYGPVVTEAGVGTGSVTTGSPCTGDISVACQYGGTGLSLAVSAQCASTGTAALTAWQITTHQAIVAGYDEVRAARETALLAALSGVQASEGVGRLISRQLTLSGLEALAAATPRRVTGQTALTAQEQRFLVDAIDWQNSTYAFFPFGAAGTSGAVRRPSPVRWAGETVTDRDDPAWMRSFMQAGSARMLATVRHGYEAALLFFLAYGYLQPAPGEIFTTVSGCAWLGRLLAALPPSPEDIWTLQVPTDHAALVVNESFVPRAAT